MYQLAELHPEFRSYAQKLTQNRVLAEDLVQEALKRYLDTAETVVSNRDGYIKRTIHNLYINTLRKEKRHRVYVLRSITSEPSVFIPTSNLETTGELDQLFSLMQNVLTPQERAVFIMKKSFEKEYEWIEEIFGIRYENARQLLHRAKCKLRANANVSLYHGGSQLYNAFLKASRSGEISDLVSILLEDIAVTNN